MKFCHLQQCGWTKKVLCLVKQVKQRNTNTLVIPYIWNLKKEVNGHNKTETNPQI